MNRPETRYAKSGDVHIAYQVVGEGPRDLVVVPGFVSHLEATWEAPRRARFFERLASFSRLIMFDKRGTGMSDRASQVFTLEQRMDDVRAVMDTIGCERAALFGVSEGGPMSFLFAATYPERTTALVVYGSYARRSWAPDHPWGLTDDGWAQLFDAIEQDWGGPQVLRFFAPSVLENEEQRREAASYLRLAANPGAAAAVMRMNREIDVRHILPAVRVPTLILHRVGDGLTQVEQARYTGVRHSPEPDRVLATVLFTDIVEATERAVALGDRRWRELLEQHHALVRRELTRFRGREVDTAGDGFLATFDGPARGVRCAQAVAEGVRGLALQVRAGLHTGECEVMGDKLGGLAVHIGARVAAQAGPGEVLVSSTVKDLVAGSGLRFADRGAHQLKGVPGEWRLFAVEPA